MHGIAAFGWHSVRVPNGFRPGALISVALARIRANAFGMPYLSVLCLTLGYRS